LLLDHVLIHTILLIFMISLISFYQVLFMSWVDFWPKFACVLKTNEWKAERWHLVVGLLDKA